MESTAAPLPAPRAARAEETGEKGLKKDAIAALRMAYRTLFRSDKLRKDAIAAAKADGEGVAEVGRLLRFIEESKRGVAAHGRG